MIKRVITMMPIIAKEHTLVFCKGCILERCHRNFIADCRLELKSKSATCCYMYKAKIRLVLAGKILRVPEGFCMLVLVGALEPSCAGAFCTIQGTC